MPLGHFMSSGSTREKFIMPQKQHYTDDTANLN